MTTTQMEGTATYPSKTVTKQQGGKQHFTRNIPWRWSSVWPKHVEWHNRRRHSNVLKSDCVLVCILKYSAWVGFFKQCISVFVWRRKGSLQISWWFSPRSRIMVRGSNPSDGEKFRTRPDWPRCPPILPYNGKMSCFPGEKRPGMALATHPHLEPMLRKGSSILLHLYVSAWPATVLTLPFTFYSPSRV